MFPAHQRWKKSPQMIGERAGFTNEKWDLEFLELIDRDPERLARMPLEDYMRLGGNEGAEVIMWLIIAGALPSGARKIHQSYYLPMTTAMAWRFSNDRESGTDHVSFPSSLRGYAGGAGWWRKTWSVPVFWFHEVHEIN